MGCGIHMYNLAVAKAHHRSVCNSEGGPYMRSSSLHSTYQRSRSCASKMVAILNLASNWCGAIVRNTPCHSLAVFPFLGMLLRLSIFYGAIEMALRVTTAFMCMPQCTQFYWQRLDVNIF